MKEEYIVTLNTRNVLNVKNKYNEEGIDTIKSRGVAEGYADRFKKLKLMSTTF